MIEIDPGHIFKLDYLDTPKGNIPCQLLTFVKRDSPPEKYPGNESHYAGTTLQEVFRACIKRCYYVNSQDYSEQTLLVIAHLRESILELERRAAIRHHREMPANLDRYREYAYLSLMRAHRPKQP